jgi:RNA polymerase sigma-70 factor (ECF subfamily)
VGDLPAGQREALELRVLQERDYRDVAASLGVTEVAARLRVMRALGALSRRLKGVTP